MERNKQFNIALIGAGYWGSKLKDYLNSCPTFALRKVCNSKSDLSEVWKDTSIDSVVIATPQESHMELCLAALENHKNILVERPQSSISYNQIEDFYCQVENSALKVMVDYTFTFSNGINYLLKQFKTNYFGNALLIKFSMKRFGKFGRGSVYWLYGSHMLSILDLFQDISTFRFSTKDLIVVDGCVESGIIFFTNESISGTIDVSLNYSGKETKVEVIGDSASSCYSILGHPTIITRCRSNPYVYSSYFEESDTLANVVQSFADLLLGRGNSNLDRAVRISSILIDLVRRK